MRSRLTLLFAALALLCILACGATAGTSCYSTYDSCPATVEAQHTYATVEAAATAAHK